MDTEEQHFYFNPLRYLPQLSQPVTERMQAGDEAIELYRRRQMLSEQLVPRRL